MQRTTRLLFLGGVILLLLVICWILLSIYNAIEAEKTLHAYYIVIDLCTRYAATNSGKWPSSWQDLINLKPTIETGGWAWPRDVSQIQERITIDFSVTPDRLIKTDPRSFTAIQQLGPNFGPDETRVIALQSELRKSL
jgi:hypothetical protein